LKGAGWRPSQQLQLLELDEELQVKLSVHLGTRATISLLEREQLGGHGRPWPLRVRLYIVNIEEPQVMSDIQLLLHSYNGSVSPARSNLS
jgi:hypothetical protein